MNNPVQKSAQASIRLLEGARRNDLQSIFLGFHGDVEGDPRDGHHQLLWKKLGA